MRLRLGVVVVIAMVAIAGCSTAPIPDPMTDTGPESPSISPDDPVETTPSTTTEPSTTMSESVPDPPSDRLGWESGYWYNETIEVDQSDGLNESELDAVVARGKARVEYIRGLEYNESVPVTIISREEFRNETEERFANRSNESKLHQDVKFEALFFLGEGESAVSQQESNTASNVLGYYAPDNHTIKIVSDNPDSLEMNEITLAQELFHALQSSHFDTGNYTQNTEELHNARDGIIEGDGNYVDYRYEKACSPAGWDCLEPTTEPGTGGDGGDVHIGMWALRYQPYSDGPSFVRDIYEAEGWDGVNAVYEQPPESTEQVIHPERYREDSPRNVTIEDRSTEEWVVPDQGNGSIDYAQFGEAGVYAMLWYPSYVESRAGNPADVVIPVNHFIERGGDRALDPYNYSHPYSTGWDGDRLLPYVTNESATTNETGYVWKLTWDSEADATEFETAYLELLAYHGAEPVPEDPGTYRIADGPYADAFRVTQSGANVTIVNAPTVDELDAVHASPEG